MILSENAWAIVQIKRANFMSRKNIEVLRLSCIHLGCSSDLPRKDSCAIDVLSICACHTYIIHQPKTFISSTTKSWKSCQSMYISTWTISHLSAFNFHNSHEALVHSYSSYSLIRSRDLFMRQRTQCFFIYHVANSSSKCVMHVCRHKLDFPGILDRVNHRVQYFLRYSPDFKTLVSTLTTMSHSYDQLWSAMIVLLLMCYRAKWTCTYRLGCWSQVQSHLRPVSSRTMTIQYWCFEPSLSIIEPHLNIWFALLRWSLSTCSICPLSIFWNLCSTWERQRNYLWW